MQAYQTRSLAVVEHVARIARRYQNQRLMRASSRARTGTPRSNAPRSSAAGYPVFTHKHHTDVAYLACARAARARR